MMFLGGSAYLQGRLGPTRCQSIAVYDLGCRKYCLWLCVGHSVLFT